MIYFENLETRNQILIWFLVWSGNHHDFNEHCLLPDPGPDSEPDLWTLTRIRGIMVNVLKWLLEVCPQKFGSGYNRVQTMNHVANSRRIRLFILSIDTREIWSITSWVPWKHPLVYEMFRIKVDSNCRPSKHPNRVQSVCPISRSPETFFCTFSKWWKFKYYYKDPSWCILKRSETRDTEFSSILWSRTVLRRVIFLTHLALAFSVSRGESILVLDRSNLFSWSSCFHFQMKE